MTRAEWIGEWLRHYADAQRFGSKDPGQVADILAGPPPAKPEGGLAAPPATRNQTN